ncbi:glucan endo-1,6-beta-glucosidase [Geosmithia morbida]|uniref:glucan endo-1,6-beta-glucosidase n=1 Tax=Geosmithia morbida TaxID=1094350 RepID=A0A9P4YQC0_9HYPO|nr:glucan endo-1,6-beta-glucosidase [Geosmithia morbida]KAF4119681.1 glucan endo-1,6-beta-glucosidase [Geosmithia morbida]
MAPKLSFAAAVVAALLAGLSSAWLPEGKLRGVNLGSMFVFEPWIDSGEWSNMGCGDARSEFDCVSSLGQDAADSAFQSHWQDWVAEDDLDEMMAAGLNTIRIPLGYWIYEDIVDSSEHFPKGGFDILKTFVGKASDRGFYIILDLHGAPGAQQVNNAFTGQYNPSADFYNDYNYGRAVQWHAWMAEQVHSNDEFRNVGMIELVNEPLQGNAPESLRSEYYVDALQAIRDAESSKGVGSGSQLHVQMMSDLWGSGNPSQYLGDSSNTAYDDHRYLKWDSSVAVSKDAYLSESCDNDRVAEDTLVIGEWSLSVPDDVEGSDDWDPSSNADFYSRWFAAQIQSYERSALGWVFWTWKAGLDDPRWSYKDALDAGIISKDLDSVINSSVC